MNTVLEQLNEDAISLEIEELTNEMENDYKELSSLSVTHETLLDNEYKSEQLLKEPELITPDVVDLIKLTTESITAILDIPDTIDMVLSYEEMEYKPVTALIVATESIGDFVRKIVASIKSMFAKIMNAGKKLFVKIVVAIDNTGKKAKGLLKRLPEYKPDDGSVMYNPAEIKKFINMFGAGIMAKGVGLKQEFLKLHDIIMTVNNFQELAGMVFNMTQKIDKMYLKAGTKDVSGGLAGLFKGNSGSEKGVFGNINLEDNTNYSEPSNIDDEKGKMFYLIYATSNTIGVLMEYSRELPEDSNISATMYKYFKLKVELDTLEDDVESLSKLSFKAMDVFNATKKVISATISEANNLKGYKNKVINACNSADKMLDKLVKESSSGKIDYIKKKLLAGSITSLRDVAVAASLGGVLAYAKNVKAMYSYSETLFNKISNKNLII